jgi:acetyl esterase/lipase
MPSDILRPPYDPELAPILAQIPSPPTLTRDIVLALHNDPSLLRPTPEIFEIIGGRPISHIERRVPGLNPTDPNVRLSIFQSKLISKGLRPCIYYIHGGGMVMLNRFMGIEVPLAWIPETDAIVVSVEYRLAPENPHPALLNDCYAGLRWVSEHFHELGIDPERVMIAGQSAGGGLAAGVALMCRDLKGPKLCAQYLSCPMLDDRNTTTSSHQYVEEGTWSRGSNIMAWNAVLGDKAGNEDVSIYAAPARAKDLSGIPTTFIDVGSAEVFRDEDIAYAMMLWASGVQAELHVHPGGFHGFDILAPNSRLGARAALLQTEWVRNVLAPKV